MKTQREVTPLTFFIDSNGYAYCIEPNGNRKQIGAITLSSASLLSVERNGKINQFIQIKYHAGQKAHKIAVIPLEEVNNKKLLKYFTDFHRVSSKRLAEEFFYHKVMELLDMDISVLAIPEFPGLVLKEENDTITEAYFHCFSNKISDIYSEIVSYPYQTKLLPEVRKTPSSMLDTINNHLDSANNAMILLTFGLVGIISTYLKITHNMPSLILRISAKNHESEALASVLIKTYNRNKPPKSLTCSKTELKKFLGECKDETAVFIDDTTSESNVKRTSLLDTILGFSADENCKPFNIAIISKTIQYLIPKGRAINIELGEDFGKNISAEELSVLADTLSEMCRYFVDIFCSHILEYDEILRCRIKKLKAENSNDFSSDTYCSAFAVMYAVFEI